MFEIGTYVTYRAEGVCVVSDIRSESFGMIGKDEEYYILTPLRDPKSTVFVPVANERLVGFIRRLMTAAELTEMITELRDERTQWHPESRARNAMFREILANGDRRELVVLVNTLCEKLGELSAIGKKPGSTDMGALLRAEHLLFEEFAVTCELDSHEQIVPILRGEIQLKPKI